MAVRAVITRGLVSSAHPVSNLRLLKVERVTDESDSEKYYRLASNELQMWNQTYWETHNREFYKVRREFNISA